MHPEPFSGTWRDTLVWDTKALIQKETHPRDPNSTETITEYRVVESFGDASLIELRLRPSHGGPREDCQNAP